MAKSNREPKLPQHNSRLREARERLGLSYKDVANRLQIPDAHTVGRWERGEHRPQAHYRRRLSELYGQSIEELGLLKTGQEDVQEETSAQNQIPENAGTGNPYKMTIKRSFTSFIGREAALKDVCALLKSPEKRLVTILGPNGVGKTRLASEVALACREQFANNICMVALAMLYDAELVLPTIARELQIRENGTHTLEEDLQLFFQHNQPFLLILDNFEHILAASRSIERLLSTCPQLKILVTSRAVLNIPGEWEFPLSPFMLPESDAGSEELRESEAIQLFIQRAQARWNAFQVTPENLPLIRQICVALDGLPLAIELAAARIKLFSLPDLLEEVSENRLQLRLLKSTEEQTVSFRPATLSDTIKWSYDLLTEPKQWLFRHISVFVGGCTVPAAKKIWSEAPKKILGETTYQSEDALSLLMSLLDYNMIRPLALDQAHAFFLMLETIRDYGLNQLREKGELESAQRAHAYYYLELLREAEPFLRGPKMLEWLTRLDRERQNLSSALAWLIASEDSERALAFSEVFGHFCGLRGYWSEEAHWLKAVLDLSSAQSASKLRGRVLRRAGHLMYRMRNLPAARTYFAEGIAVSRAWDDHYSLAGACSGLARVYQREQNLAPVQSLYEAGVEAARQSGDLWSQANALEALGSFFLAQGDPYKAAQLLRASIALAREIGDAESLTRLLTSATTVEIALEHFTQAAEFAQESYSYARALDNKPQIALALFGLAEVAKAQKDFAHAASLYEQRLQLARELDDQPTVELMRLNLSEIALAEHRFEQAASLAQTSLNFFLAHRDNPSIIRANAILKQIAGQQQDRDKAEIKQDEGKNQRTQTS